MNDKHTHGVIAEIAAEIKRIDRMENDNAK
jgi:hypothetical protein